MSVAPLAAVTGVAPAQAAPAAGDVAPVAADVAPGSAATGSATSTPSQPSAPVPPADPVLQAVDVARAAAAGRQASLAPLLADLSQAVASPALSGQVRSAIAQVLALQTPVDGPITAQVVKDAVAQSGLFLEAHLARLAPSGAAPPDLKAALLVLQRALAAVPASLSPAAAPIAASTATAAAPAAPTPPPSPTGGPAAPGAPPGPATSPGPTTSAATLSPAGPRPAPSPQAPQAPAPGPFMTALQKRPDAGPTSQVARDTPAPAPAALGAAPAASSAQPQAAGETPPPNLKTVGPAAEPTVHAESVAPASPAVAGPKASPIASATPTQPSAPPVIQALPPQVSAAALISAQSMEEAPRPAVAPPEIEPTVLPGPYEDATLDPRSAMLLLQRAFGAAPAARTGPASRAAAPPPPLRQGPTGAQAAESAALPAGDEAAIAQHLAGETDQALARLTLHQLASLPEAAGGPAWVFELPLATPQGAAMAQFVIDHDDEATSAASAEPAWRARFSINVEPLGPVHIHLRVGRESSAVTLWAERDGGVERLRSQGVALAEALGADVVIHPGAPRRSTPPPGPGQFVDQSS